jgi:hypothetical protein
MALALDPVFCREVFGGAEPEAWKRGALLLPPDEEKFVPLYVAEAQAGDPYSGPVDDLVRMNYREFEAARSVDPGKYLFTTTCWMCNWFPVIDADNVRKALMANESLIADGLPHVLMESSPGRFWLIVDGNRGIHEATAFMSGIPGQDPSYSKCCAENKRIALRAFPKDDGFIPRFVAVSGDISGQLEEFCDALSNHLQCVELWYGAMADYPKMIQLEVPAARHVDRI